MTSYSKHQKLALWTKAQSLVLFRMLYLSLHFYSLTSFSKYIMFLCFIQSHSFDRITKDGKNSTGIIIDLCLSSCMAIMKKIQNNQVSLLSHTNLHFRKVLGSTLDSRVQKSKYGTKSGQNH